MTAGERGKGVASGNDAGSGSLGSGFGAYACVNPAGTSALQGKLTVEALDIALESADLPLLFATACPEDC